jgi:hypothetical protein
MEENIDERIKSLLENTRLKELICNDAVTFKRLLELMTKMHNESKGYHVVVDEHHPAMADTPEG